MFAKSLRKPLKGKVWIQDLSTKEIYLPQRDEGERYGTQTEVEDKGEAKRDKEEGKGLFVLEGQRTASA